MKYISIIVILSLAYTTINTSEASIASIMGKEIEELIGAQPTSSPMPEVTALQNSLGKLEQTIDSMVQSSGKSTTSLSFDAFWQFAKKSPLMNTIALYLGYKTLYSLYQRACLKYSHLKKAKETEIVNTKTSASSRKQKVDYRRC